MMLYLVQVGAVFVVRGRPHTGDTVVSELFPPNSGCLKNWAGPLLSFTWNVIMPITLVVSNLNNMLILLLLYFIYKIYFINRYWVVRYLNLVVFEIYMFIKKQEVNIGQYGQDN